MIYKGSRPAIDDSGFLKELCIVDAEGAEKDGQQYLIFTLAKPRRTHDVQQAIEAYNSGLDEALRFTQIDVVTFERGHGFHLHPIFHVIRKAQSSKSDTYWTWQNGGDDANSNKKRRRVVNELESDLVEASILPAAPKRMSGKENRDEQQQQQQVIPHYGLLCIGMFYFSDA